MVHEPERLSMAIRLQQAGQLAEAEAIYRQILRADPYDANALHLMGVVALQAGQAIEAIEWIQRAIRLAPNQAGMHSNLALALVQGHRIDEAIRSYQRAVQLNPNDAEALNNLGALFKATGRVEAACLSFTSALQVRPDHAGAHSNLGGALLERGLLASAVQSCSKAVELQANNAQAHYNLGLCFSRLGQYEMAVAEYRCSVELQPEFGDAFNNLAIDLVKLGLARPAVAAAKRAVALQPQSAGFLVNLGNALKENGDYEQAIESFRKALSIQPGSGLVPLVSLMQQVCQWQGLERLVQQAIDWFECQADEEAMRSIDPFFFITLPLATTAKQQFDWTRRWAVARFPPSAPARLIPTQAQHRTPSSRIRLGYLSSDFHNHATAMLIAELFEQHDRDRFEVTGYSYGPSDGSRLRRRIVDACDRFHDVARFSDPDIAGMIARDQIDILIDLKGYTHSQRIEILAYRPAPVQVSYLGYPGTTGTDFIDYLLVDDFIVPGDQQAYYSERLVHLPGCYQANDSRREVAGVWPTRAESELDERAFVFCSFNNSYKITPAVFDVWMRLMKAVPGSVLWLLGSNRLAAVHLRQAAESRGIAGRRLVFAPRVESSKHLARHVLADLFLDTFPVNAHTTASDALRMGLPLITLAGESFVSRVAGSLLREVGLPELIASNLKEYEAMALRLAVQPQELLSIRRQLHENLKRSRLFSATPIARNIETAYQAMWQVYQAGQPARPLRIALNNAAWPQ